MSYQITLAPNRKAAARFVGKVRRRLQRGLADNPTVTRAQIARELGVHRSVVTRQLQGHADMSLGRAAELAWAMGYRPKFDLEKVGGDGGGSNLDLIVHIPGAPAAASFKVDVRSASAVVHKDYKRELVES